MRKLIGMWVANRGVDEMQKSEYIIMVIAVVNYIEYAYSKAPNVHTQSKSYLHTSGFLKVEIVRRGPFLCSYHWRFCTRHGDSLERLAVPRRYSVRLESYIRAKTWGIKLALPGAVISPHT